MTEIATGVRAKSGWLETKRMDKGGRVHVTKAHQVPSQGMYSAKEMEQVMRHVAAEVGADESQIRIDTYKHGEAPLEANPRHRGSEPSMFQRGERRRMYSGFNPSKDR